MSEDNKYSMSDLIQYSATQQPIEFGNAFDALMVDRLQDAIAAKKQEISSTMFGGPDPEEDDWDDEGEELEEPEEDIEGKE